VLNGKGSLFLTRPSLGHYLLTRDELVWRAADVLNWIDSGKLKLRIDQVYPLAEAAAAHRDLEARKTAGKLLLAVGGCRDAGDRSGWRVAQDGTLRADSKSAQMAGCQPASRLATCPTSASRWYRYEPSGQADTGLRAAGHSDGRADLRGRSRQSH